MPAPKKILVIIGSASPNSSNEKLVEHIIALASKAIEFSYAPNLKTLPHFDPLLSAEAPPPPVIELRRSIEEADGVLISTPEYIFSIPAGLKNLLEWCVATTIFTGKPTAIITASAHGQKGHEELQLILRTVMAKLSAETCLLIPGVKGKITADGSIADEATKDKLHSFANALTDLVYE